MDFYLNTHRVLRPPFVPPHVKTLDCGFHALSCDQCHFFLCLIKSLAPVHLFFFERGKPVNLVHSLVAGICQCSYKNMMEGNDLTVGSRIAPLWLSQLTGPEEQ